ncbi:MAG: YgfZ/GcvT domain-containing protein [Povalibacter sp.]
MNYTLSSPLYALPQYGSILISGVDAVTYLQGQLSFDVTLLTPKRMELATCNSAQGRVQAVLWMLARQDGIILLVASELVDSTVARLRKYTLRSKVKIESGREHFVVGGSRSELELDEWAHVQHDSTSVIRWPGDSRIMVLAPASSSVVTDESFARQWHLDDLRAGLPQLHAATHEAFVAQMLNIDLLGGISFEKGCYTGQEIIARTHFRGSVKRRMLRFAASCPPPLPGTRVLSGASHAGDVVDAEKTSTGCEMLAVISLTQQDAELGIDGFPRVRLERMPLPYEVA